MSNQLCLCCYRTWPQHHACLRPSTHPVVHSFPHSFFHPFNTSFIHRSLPPSPTFSLQEPGKLRIKDVKEAIRAKGAEQAASRAALGAIMAEGLHAGVHPLERPEVPAAIKVRLGCSCSGVLVQGAGWCCDVGGVGLRRAGSVGGGLWCGLDGRVLWCGVVYFDVGQPDIDIDTWVMAALRDVYLQQGLATGC